LGLAKKKTFANIRVRFLREEAAQTQMGETLKRLERALLEKAFRVEF